LLAFLICGAALSRPASRGLLRREIRLDIAHARTSDFWSQLDTTGVDLICGDVAASPSRDRALAFLSD
jgi:hypothetical protein